MKSRTTLTEKQLRRAARMAEEYQMSRLPQETAHEFSEKFERDMAILLQRFANGHVKTDRIRYGWWYYAKRSIAAVLLGAILTCIAMPEAVVAGYNRIIEVVERFVLDDARAIDDEYTNINAATDFVAASVKYNTSIPCTPGMVMRSCCRLKLIGRIRLWAAM